MTTNEQTQKIRETIEEIKSLLYSIDHKLESIEAEGEEIWACPHCGARTKRENNFCWHCKKDRKD